MYGKALESLSIYGFPLKSSARPLLRDRAAKNDSAPRFIANVDLLTVNSVPPTFKHTTSALSIFGCWGVAVWMIHSCLAALNRVLVLVVEKEKLMKRSKDQGTVGKHLVKEPPRSEAELQVFECRLLHNDWEEAGSDQDLHRRYNNLEFFDDIFSQGCWTRSVRTRYVMPHNSEKFAGT